MSIHKSIGDLANGLILTDQKGLNNAAIAVQEKVWAEATRLSVAAQADLSFLQSRPSTCLRC